MAETPSDDPLAGLLAARQAGAPVGITSVCSAHPLVLEATMRHAAQVGGPVLVEATSNQVDQTGGYTGMRPPDFRDLVHGAARRHGIPAARLILGGDHLGPNRWRGLRAEAAMAHAERLVADYAAAGFTKLHLDCSMACADDPPRLGDEIVASRTARLLAVGERAATHPGAVCYVIGTEVPTPGGAAEDIDTVVPTTADAARATLAAHRTRLEAEDLGHVWPRVRALVVQPGIEFDGMHVVDYDEVRVGDLPWVLGDEPAMVFEAHSTDYQTVGALVALVRDGWAVLKVGPALTFALREALFALAAIEDELIARDERSELLKVLERRMLAEPAHWEGHYHGETETVRLALRYSLSDRVRYYWSDPEVARAVDRLVAGLRAVEIPLPLLSQYLPAQHTRVREDALAPEPEALVVDHVRDVLRNYTAACAARE